LSERVHWQPAQDERLQPLQLAPALVRPGDPAMANADGWRSTFSAWQAGQVTCVGVLKRMVSKTVPQS
jgi:hypothetical protein